MSVFDDLERELRSGVRRAHGPVVRRWRRPTLLAVAAALAVTTGALAAGGAIRIAPFHDDHDPIKPRPGVGPGLRAGPAQTLALRVRDPAGGPPWTLRVFTSTRGGHCVQVGQVVRGHFGVFVPPNTLEPLRAWPGGASSLCSGQAHAGFPVVRGLQRVRTIGGMGDRRRCPDGAFGDCPITSVTVLRYGLLGPRARRVRLLDEDGRVLASMRTSVRTGGAYLFAVAQPVAPYVAVERAERAWQAAIVRATKAERARGAPPAQAFARARRAVGPAPRAHVPLPRLAIVATFAGGRTLRVAGPGRTRAPLPGLERPRRAASPALPHDVPVAVRVHAPGRYATVTLSFRAPRAITRFDVHYTTTLHGRSGRRCDRPTGGLSVTTRDVAAGETVRVVLRRPRGFTQNGREGWCPGRFSGEIRYSTPRRTVVIGRYAFRIP